MASANERKTADITAEEFKKIETSLQNKEFRAMFFDYMQEISDPENRKIYEAELTQLEAERGNDVRFVTPSPGHVVKTRAFSSGSGDVGTKVFINMCTSPEIEAATPGSTAVQAGAKGMTWNIPYSLTKPKEDLDVGGKPCTVFDCVFHPTTYARGRDNPAFERLLVSTAMEGIQREFGVAVEKSYRTPKMAFKGTPVATVIRTTKTSAAGKTKLQQEQDPKAAFLESLGKSRGSPPLPSVSSAADPPILPTLFPPATTAAPPPPPPLIEELSPAAGPAGATRASMSPPAIVEPKYTVTHRGVRADYQQYTQERERQRGARPDALVVRIELPTVRTSGEIDLTPLARTLSLHVKGKYALEVTLPFEIVVDASSASFDRGREVLEVVLPVVRAPDVALVSYLRVNVPTTVPQIWLILRFTLLTATTLSSPLTQKPPSTAVLESGEDEETAVQGKDDVEELEVPAAQTPIGSEDGDGWVKVESPAPINAHPQGRPEGAPKVITPSSPAKDSPKKEALSLTAAPVVLANTLIFDLDD
ncbi:Protein kintoun [Geranomyces michiganensis]|nr:Protein kintoun [Geranomyces michiganensis]